MTDTSEDPRPTTVEENPIQAKVASIAAEVKAEAKEALSSVGLTPTDLTTTQTKSEETTTSNGNTEQKDSTAKESTNVLDDGGDDDHQVSDRREDRNGARRGRGGYRGGRGRGGYYQSGMRSRFDNLEESDDQDEIRRQIEFYFSDSNLPIDPYLFKLVGGHANNYVPLKVIADFSRMRRFQPYSTVLEAVTQSHFLEVNDKEEIRRKQPLSDRFTDDCEENKKIQHGASMDKSIYAKGFGEETETTQIDIEEFFQPFNVKVVRLRRTGNMTFKGSVFVEFHDEAAQKDFLDHDSKPAWKGKTLEIMSKRAYVEMKHDGIVDGLVKPRSPMRNNNNYSNARGRGRGRGNYHNDRKRDSKHSDSRDEPDKDDWNKRRERDNDRDSRRSSKRARGHRPRRGNGRDRNDRDSRRDDHSPSGSGKEDHDSDKVKSAAAQEEKTEGIAKRLGVSEGETGTKRSREDGDEGRDEGEAKKVKEAETTQKTAVEA